MTDVFFSCCFWFLWNTFWCVCESLYDEWSISHLYNTTKSLPLSRGSSHWGWITVTGAWVYSYSKNIIFNILLRATSHGAGYGGMRTGGGGTEGSGPTERKWREPPTCAIQSHRILLHSTKPCALLPGNKMGSADCTLKFRGLVAMFSLFSIYSTMGQYLTDRAPLVGRDNILSWPTIGIARVWIRR